MQFEPSEGLKPSEGLESYSLFRKFGRLGRFRRVCGVPPFGFLIVFVSLLGRLCNSPCLVRFFCRLGRLVGCSFCLCFCLIFCTRYAILRYVSKICICYFISIVYFSVVFVLVLFSVFIHVYYFIIFVHIFVCSSSFEHTL